MFVAFSEIKFFTKGILISLQMNMKYNPRKTKNIRMYLKYQTCVVSTNLYENIFVGPLSFILNVPPLLSMTFSIPLLTRADLKDHMQDYLVLKYKLPKKGNCVTEFPFYSFLCPD